MLQQNVSWREHEPRGEERRGRTGERREEGERKSEGVNRGEREKTEEEEENENRVWERGGHTHTTDIN